jgi:hypothetical protein
MQGIASCNRVWVVRMVSHTHSNLELHSSRVDEFEDIKG